MHLKFVYLVKLLSKRQANLNPKNLENRRNFEGEGLTLAS